MVPLATVIIGGLISSMFLTLVVVPAVYTKIERLRVSIPALFLRPFAIQRLKRMQALAAGTSHMRPRQSETH